MIKHIKNEFKKTAQKYTPSDKTLDSEIKIKLVFAVLINKHSVVQNKHRL